MQHLNAPNGATGDVRPHMEEAVASTVADRSTRVWPTPSARAASRKRRSPRKTRPPTWLEAHPPLADVLQAMREEAVSFDCPELALAFLHVQECASAEADPGECGEGETIALAALRALEGLGRFMMESAREAQRLHRPDAGGVGPQREVNLNAAALASGWAGSAGALAVDMNDLYRVSMGIEEPRGGL
jgi:hypothetical protein